jgi:hypothetical protein
MPDMEPSTPLAPPQLHAETTNGNGAAARFLVLRDISVSRAGNRVACRVRLTRDHTVFEGEAREPDTEPGRARAAARATLAAAEQAAGSNAALGLEGLLLNELFHRRYVAVSIEGSSGRRHALLSGLVPVDPGRSTEEAAAMATLHAIDRWIAL